MQSIKGKRQIRKGMYQAESMMPDPIALSPLGCAHEERMRTYGQPIILPSKHFHPNLQADLQTRTSS